MKFKKVLALTAVALSSKCAYAGWSISPMSYDLKPHESSMKISIAPEKGVAEEFKLKAFKVVTDEASKSSKQVPTDDLEIQNLSGEPITVLKAAGSAKEEFVVKFKGKREATKTKYYVQVVGTPPAKKADAAGGMGMGVKPLGAYAAVLYVLPEGAAK